MPSTYTLNNGIELIATGEQSGTWGDTTNVNLGLIDTALDGQVTVTLPAAGSSGSPNALAISDGSASDGRNRLIIFDDGGDLGATAFVQLTPNDAEKIVYIRNNLTGGRAITLFQGTYNASNDYEVPAGTTAVVFFNGGGAGAVAANVFNNAFFDSLRLGAVSVTAILDEDNMASDSATALATQQSIKAYVDAQVGANNELSEVLANGNTSGGNNIQMTTTDEVQFRDTALTISSSVDGQLDIAADVELEIVAPTLDINASTAVTIDTTTMTMTGSVNVVGDLDVDNLNINGNSIISTNTDGNIALTPNGTGEVDISKVDIDGGTIDGTVIGGASAAAISGTTGSFSGNLTVDTNTLFVDAANNRVGMGTSSPARQVTINSSFPILQFTNPTTGTTSNDGLLIFQSGLDAYFSNQEAGPTIFETNNAERMRIDASGNVGIGTSLPGNPLTLVYGGGAVGAQIIGNASYAQMQVTAAGANTNSYFTFGANGTGKGIIQRNSTDVITIDASNNVGIGTSSPSTYGKVVSSGGTFALVTDTPAERRLSFWSTANGNSENGYIQVQNDGLTTNTGEMLFATKNTAGTLAERMRITSTGLVGIGTSSPAVKLTSQLASSGISGIASTAAALFENSGNSDVVIAAGTSSKSRIAFGDSGDWIAGRIDYDHSDNSMRFGTAGSGERLRIDASGNVGIGTGSPADKLVVNKGSAGTIATFTDGVNSNFVIETASLITTVGNTGGSTALAFKSANAERMRIDASGNLLVGTTTVHGQITSLSDGTKFQYASYNTDTSGVSQISFRFIRNGVDVGSITTTSSATAFNISSDYRLKENVVPLAGAADRLAQIPVHRFNFIADPDKTVDGFIAHEVQAFVPEAVTGEKDAVDKDGKPVHQGIDQSKLVPLLTAALQEALTEIADLKARVAALEAQP
jgi:hypothetical protein